MLGGLYGDLPPPSSTDEENRTPNNSSNVWSSSAKMAPSTLRKPAFPPPQTLLKPQLKPKPPPPKTVTLSAPAPDDGGRSLVGVTSTVVEEYDPARPNDYEEYRREKKRKVAEAEATRELERRRREEEERERERREREAAAAVTEREKRERESVKISGEEAWKRRAAMGGTMAVPPRSPSPPGSGGDGFAIGKSESGGLGIGAGGQMSAAQRMMAKMGWKEGQGLGKQEQGITTPLVAKKTDRRAGVIINASEKKVKFTPTRVLLLRNMVCDIYSVLYWNR